MYIIRKLSANNDLISLELELLIRLFPNKWCNIVLFADWIMIDTTKVEEELKKKKASIEHFPVLAIS